MSDATGHVALVGAGPGDPSLLTQRGAELLRKADVVVFDRLVCEDALALAPADAELIDVGKAPHAPSVAQETIHAILVDRARAGRAVVRLKGGDPFVFGRGFEELVACRAAGVECEVVPGVSSALAAPALAGVPVTERGVARSFAVVTARGGEGLPDAEPDYAALARIDTVVVLMGRERLDAIAARLVDAGKPSDTPAIVVERASWPDERRVSSTLGTIADAANSARIAAPAVLVVGATAAHARAASMVRRPLDGMRVLVTRPRGASIDLVRHLRARGADVVNCPLIRIDYPEAAPPLPDLADFRWIVLTSLHGVRGFWRTLRAAGKDARSLAACRVAAVGPKTASELWSVARIAADVVPDEFRATALVRTLATTVRGERVLFPCGTLARDEVAAGLHAAGADVHELEVYDTVPIAPSAAARARIAAGVDAIVLYSPSATRSLVEHRVDIGAATIVCVGPTTAAEVRSTGLGEPLVPGAYGDAGVLATLDSLAATSSGGRR
ncbi:MAG: uroporphyrinogen-III C-methyltransferase [Phycisphaerales bacterium]